MICCPKVKISDVTQYKTTPCTLSAPYFTYSSTLPSSFRLTRDEMGLVKGNERMKRETEDAERRERRGEWERIEDRGEPRLTDGI